MLPNVMQHQISLTKKLILFYIIIGIPISYASYDNLVNGIILHKNPTIGIGAFSILGFVILPIMIWASYKNNKCILSLYSIKIGKNDYPYSDYEAEIIYVEKKFAERPIVSLWKKKYPLLVITDKKTNEIHYEEVLSCSKKEIALITKSIAVY